MRTVPDPRSFSPRSLLLVAAICGAPLASPARAQELELQDRATQRDAAGDAEEADARDRRRLLRLDDGRVLRVRSRFRDGRWERRVGPDWVALREGPVVEAHTEREVLGEARQKESRLKRKDHEGRVALAVWMAEQGLGPEAIVQLDRVLRAQPDHASALRAIRETHIPLDLPPEAASNKAAEIQALVLAGAGGSQATREVAIQRLAEQGAYVDLRELVTQEMGVPQNRRRQFAAHAARRLYRGELVNELSTRSILDTFRSVRAEAARGLRDAENVAVVAPAINALSSRYANVRTHAAEALGNMGYAAAVEPLVNRLASLQAGGAPGGSRANIYIGFQTAYVSDFDVEIAQGASIADPIVAVQASGVIFDARTTVQMSKVIEMRTVIASLGQLTNAKVASNPNAWAKWWGENQGDWRSLDLAKAATRAPATGGQRQ